MYISIKLITTFPTVTDIYIVFTQSWLFKAFSISQRRKWRPQWVGDAPTVTQPWEQSVPP